MTTIILAVPPQAVPAPAELAALEAKSISAWFGDRKVLDRVSLYMPGGSVSALIGPSGCGNSTVSADSQSDARADPVRGAGW